MTILRRQRGIFFSLSCLFGMVASLLGLIGCGKAPDAVKLAKVEGVVKYQGKPVSDVFVTFSKPGSPVVAGGGTDAEGRFRLTTYQSGDGAPVGENSVTISVASQQTAHRDEVDAEMERVKAIQDAEERTRKMMELSHHAKDPRAKGRSGEKPKPKIPLRYAQPSISKLSFTVKPDIENHCEFELTD